MDSALGGLFDVISRAAHARVTEMSAQELSMLLWAFVSSSRTVDLMLLDAVAASGERRVRELEPQALAYFAWAYGTTGHSSPRLFDAIARECVRAERMHGFCVQSLARLAWGFCRADHLAPALFDALGEAACAALTLQRSRPQELVTLATAFADMGHSDPSLFAAIAEAAHGRLREFNALDLSSIARAFARAMHPSVALFNAISDEAKDRLHEFDDTAIARIARAFAVVEHESHPLIDAIANEVLGRRRLRSFTPQALSALAGGFAWMPGAAHQPLLEAIAAELTERLHERAKARAACGRTATLDAEADDSALDMRSRSMRVTSQTLALSAWAYARKGCAAPRLFETIASEASTTLQKFSTQGLSTLAWSFATARHPAPGLFDAVAHAACMRPLRRTDPQALVNLAWAFATAQHPAQQLFRAIASEASSDNRMHAFAEQGLSSLAWAFATAGHADHVLFDAIACAIQPRLDTISELQTLSMTAWSFAVLDIPAGPASLGGCHFTRRCVELVDTAPVAQEALVQLHQFNLWCIERGCVEAVLPTALAIRCRDAMVSQSAEPSSLQQQVSDTLRSLGCLPHDEATSCSGYPIDMLVHWRGADVAIEVDGPSHFVRGSQQPTSAAALKRRQLESLGSSRLVSVPYWEWCQLGRKERSEQVRAQQEYVLAKLEGCVPG